MRVGLGYDTHRFGADRPLVLGGVEVPCELGGLLGHSDADVVAHAVIDALLGAVGAGDIGSHFPDDEERWRDADSLELLRITIAEIGVVPVNVDVTVVCEQPRLAAHRARISERLTEAVGAPVSVKATTNERMGAIGAGEGILALAVALVEVPGEVRRPHA